MDREHYHSQNFVSNVSDVRLLFSEDGGATWPSTKLQALILWFPLDQSCDSAQVLYRNCTAIDSNSLTQCRKTAEDIFLDSPLCPKHALLEVANAPRKKTIHSLVRPAQKKVLSSKGGVTKTVRGRKILGQPKV